MSDDLPNILPVASALNCPGCGKPALERLATGSYRCAEEEKIFGANEVDGAPPVAPEPNRHGARGVAATTPQSGVGSSRDTALCCPTCLSTDLERLTSGNYRCLAEEKIFSAREVEEPENAHASPRPGRVPPPEPETHEDGTKTCPECAERVQGAALVCRFCGYRFAGRQQAAAPAEANTSGAAVAAFICSLVGLWVAGIPLGIHAQRQIDKSGGRKTGRGFATAGIILGVLGLIGTVVLIILIVAAANHTSGCIYNAVGECVPQ
jgi:ribosomal protein L37AE/L43A